MGIEPWWTSPPKKNHRFTIFGLVTPPKTNECPLKINGWFRCISYWNSPFLGDDFVHFQGCFIPSFFFYCWSHRPWKRQKKHLPKHRRFVFFWAVQSIVMSVHEQPGWSFSRSYMTSTGSQQGEGGSHQPVLGLKCVDLIIMDRFYSKISRQVIYLGLMGNIVERPQFIIVIYMGLYNREFWSLLSSSSRLKLERFRCPNDHWKKLIIFI